LVYVKIMGIIALICMVTAFLAGCVAENAAQAESSGQPGGSPVPGNQELGLPAGNRTPGGDPPVIPNPDINMTGRPGLPFPVTGESMAGDEGPRTPPGMNGTPLSQREIPAGNKPMGIPPS